MRLLVQSMSTGRFICPNPHDGSPEWVACLREAGGGVVTDLEHATQLMRDFCDFDDQPVIVDLDRLGTVNDYPTFGRA